MVWMVHSGCRVEETLRISFGEIKIVLNENNEEETNFMIRGKTGFRKVRGMIGTVSVYRRLCKRHPKHKKTDLLFPHNHRDGLNNLLGEAKLKQSIHGARNAKSFRSTHIMFGLIDKKEIAFIARNCGTSIPVIDNYYAKYLDVDMYDASVVSLPKKITKKKSKK